MEIKVPSVEQKVLTNMICLVPHVHKYWGKSLFTLKPIFLSAKNIALALQFFWLGMAEPGAQLQNSQDKELKCGNIGQKKILLLTTLH